MANTRVTTLVAKTKLSGFLRFGKLLKSWSGLHGGRAQLFARTSSADQSMKLKNIS